MPLQGQIFLSGLFRGVGPPPPFYDIFYIILRIARYLNFPKFPGLSINVSKLYQLYIVTVQQYIIVL